MIETLSNMTTTLVVAIILITIIEMILPSGNNKKYIKFFSGIILMIIIINPIIGVLNSDIDIDDFIKENQVELANVEYEFNQNYIYDTYRENLKQDIIKRLEENGYEVVDLELTVKKTTYEPTELQLQLKHSDGEIQPIVVEIFKNSQDQLSSYDKEIVRTLINSNYGIKKSKIVINDEEE